MGGEEYQLWGVPDPTRSQKRNPSLHMTASSIASPTSSSSTSQIEIDRNSGTAGSAAPPPASTGGNPTAELRATAFAERDRLTDPSANPFLGSRWRWFHWLMLIFLWPLGLLRMILCAIILAFAAGSAIMVARISHGPMDDLDQPDRVLGPRALAFKEAIWKGCISLSYFVAGIRIRVEGALDPRAVILVAQHTDFIPIFFFVGPCRCSVVAAGCLTAESGAFLVNMMRLVPSIGVDLHDRQQGRVLQALRTRASLVQEHRPGFHPVLLFPEGCQTNGSCLAPFRTGAFRAGVPLQPVVVKFLQAAQGGPMQGSGYGDKDWTVVMRLLGVLHTFAQLCYPLPKTILFKFLPLKIPNPAELADPESFTVSVRNEMARAGDLKLAQNHLDYRFQLAWTKELRRLGLSVRGYFNPDLIRNITQPVVPSESPTPSVPTAHTLSKQHAPSPV